MPQLAADWIKRLGQPYLPGSGREAPHIHFEEIKSTIPVRVDADVLATAPAFALARDLYATRYFWEAREVLKAMWNATLPMTKPHAYLEGLIQLTDACIKVRMRQPNAAVRLVKDAERLLGMARDLEVPHDIEGLIAQCAAFEAAIQTGSVGEALSERPTLDAGPMTSAHAS